MGQCVDRLAFLVPLTKYIKHWHRAVVYMGLVIFGILSIAFVYSFSITPIVLWCLSTSTIIPMVLLFLIGALNFVLAIGQK